MRRDRFIRMGKKTAAASTRRRPAALPGLLRRIESSQLKDVDVVVNHLRSTYPEYSRIQLQPLTRNVRDALDQLRQRGAKGGASNSPGHGSDVVLGDDFDEAETQGPSRKRRKQGEEGRREERLRRLEGDYIRRNKGRRLSESVSEDMDESDGAGDSTSEDTIYSEKVEPEFDFVKSMLRVSYGGSPSGLEHKNVEIDDRSKEKKVASMGGDQGRRKRAMGGAALEESEVNGGVAMLRDGPRFKDLGGISRVLEELRVEVIMPLYHPELPRWLGVRPMSGILLHGLPGCGKTKLAHAIANETGVPFYHISATELVSGVSGGSEEKIRELFSKAYRNAPSIVFIDEIDAIASKRENLQRGMEKRIVTQLMTCMDDPQRLVQADKENLDSESTDSKPGYVLVIGATNMPDAVDPALRRPGRFDREISLGVPDENARAEILRVLTRNLRLEGELDLLRIAKATPGFVAADLTSLVNEAGNLAMRRFINHKRSELSEASMSEEDVEEWWRSPWSDDEIFKLNIEMADFEAAVKSVQPSLRREGFAEIPNVKWEDVGGLDTLRQEFERHVIRRIKHPELYKELGMSMQTGFLLFGPPGCGKTLIAKAVANAAGANFIHIKGPELLNKYVGESESNMRKIFASARACSPCIIFFDEVDAIGSKRGKEGGWVVKSLLNQLLIELDGAEDRRGVYVIGATNRPQDMDPALLRPGRFGKPIYVSLPTADERVLIVKAHARRRPIDASVDLEAIARSKACENLSGDDLFNMMERAAMACMEDYLDNGSPVDTVKTIKAKHFAEALQKVTPSVSKEERHHFDKLARRFQAD
ncbi:Cell division control protein 48 homolog C-like protein [Drosera capensis]